MPNEAELSEFVCFVSVFDASDSRISVFRVYNLTLCISNNVFGRGRIPWKNKATNLPLFIV